MNESELREKQVRLHEIELVLLTILVVAAIIFMAFVVSFTVRGATETIIPTVREVDPGTFGGAIEDLREADNTRMSALEEDVTASLNQIRWLKPNGDAGPNEWGEGGTSGCAPATLEYCYVDDDPVHDGNTTILYRSAAEVEGTIQATFTMGDLPITDVSIDSVTEWSVVRKNQSAGVFYTIRISVSGTDCTGFSPVLTQAFANYSAAVADVCGGSGWTAAQVNLANTEHLSQCPCIGNPLDTFTATGLTVQYDDRDQQLGAYLNFTNIPCPGGCDYVLRFEGYEDLLSESAFLQVFGDAGWETILTLATGGDSAFTYPVPAEYADSGSIFFRLIDSVSNEETGETVYLDLFVLDVTVQGNPGIGLSLVEISCTYSWPSSSIRCSVVERIDPRNIEGRIWTVDGEVVAQGTPGSMEIAHPTGISGLAPFKREWNVTFKAVLTTGAAITDSAIVTADTRLLWIVYGIVVLIPVAAIIRKIRPTRASSEPPKREER